MVNKITIGTGSNSVELVQRTENGKILIVTGASLNDDIAFISSRDFLDLIQYYITCKRENKPIA